MKEMICRTEQSISGFVKPGQQAGWSKQYKIGSSKVAWVASANNAVYSSN